VAFGFTYTLPTISGTHTDFPVVLKTADFPSAAVDGGANSLLNGGGNLRAYTDDTKATQLPLEVVRLVTGGTPDCQVWVKIPSAATGSTIYLEADDTETSQPAVTDTFGRNEVWSDYEAVHHLEEAANTTTDGYISSTGSFDGTGISMSEASVSAQLGDGQDLDGTDDAINLGTALPREAETNNAFTISAWVNPDAVGSVQAIYASYRGIFGLRQFRLSISTTPKFVVGFFTSSNEEHTAIGGTPSNGNWFKVTGRWTGTELSVLVNGAVADTNNVGAVQLKSLASNPQTVALGRYTTADTVASFNGQIDEARFKASVHSDDWEATEYDNESAATAWGTVGDWEEPGGGITGSGSPQAETATSSGTGIRTITGDGTPTATTATASGEGTVGNIITGSGDIQADTSTTSGIGERIVTGSGIPVAATATASGVGTRVITGTSTSVADTATSTGEGGVGITGSGSPVADTATVSGVGTRAITGTGATQSTTAIASGAGERAVTGSGTPTADTATVSGTGERTVTGTGATQSTTAIASGAGERAVTGSGSPQATAATVSAVGERVITATAVTQAATATATAAGERIVTATATVQAAVATSGGSGAVEGAVAGSGAGQVDTATVTGAGTRTVAASAVATANTATTSGAGTRIVTATAAVQADVATTAAQGGAQQDGSAVVQATAATASGAGTRAIVGTGAVIAGMATAAGAGVPGIAGGAGVQADTAATSGAGVRTISGAGATQAQTALVAAAGVLVESILTFPERQRGLGGKIIVGRRGKIIVGRRGRTRVM
jgi:hypothetical protein